jgi:CBS domain containing-hemolysin-like protein
LRSEKVLSYNVSIIGIGDVVLLRGLLILGLIGLNAFFAATEYALLSVRRTRIEQLAREGDARARLVQSLLADIGSLISGTQLSVTVVSLLMGWLGQGFIAAALQHLFDLILHRHASAMLVHSMAAACAFVLITVFLMVLGELVPKAVAYDNAEMVSLVVARPMLIFLKLSRYAVGALVGMSNGVLGALGRSPLRGYRPLPTPEEVKLIVSSIRKHGLLREEQEDIIDTVFDLDRILVREIMVPWTRITCLPLTQDLRLLLDRIVKDQHSRLPIYEGSPDHIVGILYTKDLLRVVSERLKGGVPLQVPMDLRPILRQPMIVPEAKPLSQVLEEARRHHSHLALVVDEFGTYVGLVTVEDVLEQLVGEIRDEYDQDEQAIHQVSGNVLLMDASISLRELANDYEIALPRGLGYETLAGFVLSLLGVIPQGGESVTYEGRRFTVAEMDGRRVAKVRIEKLPLTPPQARPASGRPQVEPPRTR